MRITANHSRIVTGRRRSTQEDTVEAVFGVEHEGELGFVLLEATIPEGDREYDTVWHADTETLAAALEEEGTFDFQVAFWEEEFEKYEADEETEKTAAACQFPVED